MSDPDPTPDDLVVSAVLDGEASPAEAERVASDPRLAARLDQLRAVAAAVGGPVPLVDPEVREAHLAAALIEARRLAADPPTDGSRAEPIPPPPPVDLAAARARRRPATARVLLSVAAALLVVVAAGAMLVRLGDLGGSGGSDEVATDADEARSSADSTGAAEDGADDAASSEAFTPEAGDATGEDSATPTTTADAPASAAGAIDPELVSLGTFARAEDLTAAVRGRLVLDPTPDPAGEDPVCQDDFPVPTTLLGRATVADEEGLVYVDAEPGSGRQVWFVDPTTAGAAGEACRRIVPVDVI